MLKQEINELLTRTAGGTAAGALFRQYWLPALLANVFFDTCVYHQAGIDLLGRVIPADNVLFASEMLGAVRGTNPETGSGWDDTKRYVEGLGLSEQAARQVFELNARRVYPRLDTRLARMV